MIQMKRVYEEPTESDGYRVLVERLWPRGLRKEAAKLDAWEKAIAPSTDLRRWYGHDPAKWEEFGRRYERELASSEAQAALHALADRGRHGAVTLLYSTHESDLSNAAILLRILQAMAGSDAR